MEQIALRSVYKMWWVFRKHQNTLTVAIASHCQPLQASGNVLRTLLLCASLGLNTFLATKLLHHQTSSPLREATTIAEPMSQIDPAAATASNGPNEILATNVSPTFRWDQIESSDYRQYIANLRAVGCPEVIIRDIIRADVNQLFRSRLATIWKPQVREYWQKSTGNNANPDQELKLIALNKEKALVLFDLLGIRLNDQQMINTVHLQLYGNERDLLFLPTDKRETALQALADADFERSAQQLRARNGFSSDMEQKLFQEALQTLSSVLSPEELEEFRLRASPKARRLREEIKYFGCTPEEMRQLLDYRERAGDKNQGDLLNRGTATEEVRKLFGDERAKEFERVTDLLYVNTRRAAEDQGVSLDHIEQAWRVTRDTRDAASAVAKNSSLSEAERAERLQTLKEQATWKLNELLGSKAAHDVVRDLRVILNATPAQ